MVDGVSRCHSPCAPRGAPPILERIQARVLKLSRERLEELVCASAHKGTPIDCASLEPPTARAKVCVAQPVLGASAGLLAWLPEDVFDELVAQLTATARLCLSTRVCKTLIAACARVPWAKLRLEDRRAQSVRSDDTLWLAVGTGWLSMSMLALTTLALRFEVFVPTPAQIGAMVRSAPRLTSLSLAGKKMTSPVMKELVNSNHLKLAHLKLGWHASNKTDAVKLLTACSSLEHLHVGNRLPFDSFASVYGGWRTARGGEPLLTELTLSSNSVMIWGNDDYLRRLGDVCPSLRVLNMEVDFTMITPNKPLNIPTRLRKLTLTLCAWDNNDNPHLHMQFGQFRQADGESLLRRVIDSCPVVQELEVGWGWGSGAYQVRVGDALQRLPPTLTSLTLNNMRLHWGALGNIARPELRTLTMCNCSVDKGPNGELGADLRALRAAGTKLVFLA